MNTPISYFDCNASFGSPPAGAYRPCTTVDELLAEMDRVAVDRALVRHALMRDQSPVVGNAVLAESIAGHPRLVGSWAILPPQTGELPPATEFFAAMREANVRALWAFPHTHRYLLNRVTFGPFLDEVSERRIPLFTLRREADSQSGNSWEVVYGLLDEYPDLRLVMAAQGPWGEDRYFRPLLEQYPGFHIDISRYELDCGLREVVTKYGPERLLYGSNFPYTPMGGPRLMVAHGDLDEGARRAIAGDNLRRLLKEVVL